MILPDLLRVRATQAPTGIACRTATGVSHPLERTWTWAELWEHAHVVARALLSYGVTPGMCVAVVSRPRPEWMIVEHGAWLAGAIVLGIDPQTGPDLGRAIVASARPAVAFVESDLVLTADAWELSAAVTIVFGERGETALQRSGVVYWDDFQGQATMAMDCCPPADVDAPAALFFTSGTSGTPKGMLYSHRQLLIAVEAIACAFPTTSADSTVCWLSHASLFQRMVNLLAVRTGMEMVCLSDGRRLLECLPAIRPTFLVAVPRILEKWKMVLCARATHGRWPSRRLLQWALSLGRGAAYGNCAPRTGLGCRLRRRCADFLLRGLRASSGGRIRYLVIGSAALGGDVLEFFDALGIAVYEGYAMTENAVPIAVNRPGARRAGSVGPVLAPNDIRVTHDGEILVRGPGVCQRQLGHGVPPPRCTPDGYLYTGDCGTIDADGFLYLSGRRSGMIKTSTGRRVYPEHIEATYRQSPLIEHIMVCGDGRPFLVALIAVQSVTQEPQEPIGLEAGGRLRERLASELERCGTGLADYERVRKFAVLSTPLAVETGELTATHKIRREVVMRRYGEVIDALYEPDVIASRDDRAVGVLQG